MIMKKISLLLMVSLLSTGLFAQKAPAVSYGNNELDLSYGLFTTPQFVDIFVDIFSAVFSFGTYQQDNVHYTGGIILTYKHAFNDRWLLGFSTAYDGRSADLLNKDRDSKKGSYVSSYITPVVSFDYRYLMKEKVQLYSGIGLGATFLNEHNKVINPDTNEEETSDNNQVFFDFQVNLIGVRVGKKLAGFAELGFGYKGIINGGISYQF